jgi:hypothetical protein
LIPTNLERAHPNENKKLTLADKSPGEARAAC